MQPPESGKDVIFRQTLNFSARSQQQKRKSIFEFIKWKNGIYFVQQGEVTEVSEQFQLFDMLFAQASFFGTVEIFFGQRWPVRLWAE